MQEQKIIATDMDGTFLNDHMDYDRERFARLHARMVRHGFRFVVASGNQYFQLRSFFKDYPDTIYLSENGALVRDPEQIYFKSAFPKDAAFRIIDTLIDFPAVEWTACGLKSAYVLRTASMEYIEDTKRYYHRMQLIDSPAEIDDDILKFSTHCPGDETQNYINEYARRFKGFAEPTSSGHGDIDIIQPGIHKARGLAELGEVLDVSAENMVTFGNGGNDIEMLKYAGEGVAVANSDPDVLAVADHVTADNNKQGVLDYIDGLCSRG
ncbi:Cof-type HAD-IIB family hydrolase [Lacticaseibacillus hulanensis]|uniref:Cof-type HAD-IIB family hydrolase n=1 Tax=Lacticaseibacillus hulanensis TaxID=2493111 RepID=UPI000FDCDC53|nr:Cof-type HAD-IIB family hydrolase [Lacticaseibacillus hulanensis]